MHCAYSKTEGNKTFNLKRKCREDGMWTRKVNWRLFKQKEGNNLHIKTGWTCSAYKDTGETEAPQKVHIQGICK